MNSAIQCSATGLPPAALIFANELAIAKEDESGFQTPFGRFQKPVFFVGTLTEKIVKTGKLSSLRVSDPTGVFTISLNWQNNSMMKEMEEISIPSFVSVSGDVRFRRFQNKLYIEVVPEVITQVSRTVRDEWLISAAESLLVRLEKSSPSAERDEFTKTVLFALESVKDDSGVQAVSDETLLSIITELSGKRGAPILDVIEKAQSLGMSESEVKTALGRLLEIGECYTPTTELIKIA